MTEEEDPYKERRNLTFAQAEGEAELPRQLKLKEISDELRAVLWGSVHESLTSHIRAPYSGASYSVIDEPWLRILKEIHILRRHRMIDDFDEDGNEQIQNVKEIFEHGDYVAIFDWLQEVLQRDPPDGFTKRIRNSLIYCRAAYRVVDGNLIVPATSEAEVDTLKRAFADLAATEFHGARAHLRKSTELLTTGQWSDSVRESIHAVESVARMVEDTGKFSDAITRLEKKTVIHGSMKKAFLNLYGYASDQGGIRHPLLEDDTPAVDEQDALFMIGACAASVSYLIKKAKAAGLLSKP